MIRLKIGTARFFLSCSSFSFFFLFIESIGGIVPDTVISTQLAHMIAGSGTDLINISFPERDIQLRASSEEERDNWLKG